MSTKTKSWVKNPQWEPGPSPGFSSRGAKNHEGPNLKNTVLDLCSNQEAKREMGGYRFTTGPPAGDGPGHMRQIACDRNLR